MEQKHCLIPKLNNLIELASVINENYSGTDLSNVVIEISVNNTILQKLNEELFFRNNADKVVYGSPTPTDELDINIGNIRFRCIAEKEYDG